jgi:hypothetical protein
MITNTPSAMVPPPQAATSQDGRGRAAGASPGELAQRVTSFAGSMICPWLNNFAPAMAGGDHGHTRPINIRNR